MTPHEFAAKVDWEGGLYEAVTSYGLSEKDLNRDDDPEFYDHVAAYVEWTKSGESLVYVLECMLDEYFEEE